MPDQFIEFQEQVALVKQRYEQGEITAEERDNLVRQMQLVDEQWGDVWMLSPAGQWFRRASGSSQWMPDFPPALIDTDNLPGISSMNLAQLSYVIQNCSRCALHAERTRAVPGEGNPKADIMLIGEGPGYHEDRQARPFVGASGKFLEQLLNDIGYRRKDVFITNVVKCRPPGNRDPQADELAACSDYLERQIELVDPKIIVTLGRFSMYRYFPGAAITRIHGQPKWEGRRLIVPMFHPAAALRNPKWRTAIVEDFQQLPTFLADVRARRADQASSASGSSDNSGGEQLTMF
jgi:DNA polymerase